MTRPPRGSNRNRLVSVRRAGLLAIFAGLVLSVLVLVIMYATSDPPAPTSNPQSQDPAFSTPRPGPTTRPALAEHQETPVSTSSASPAASPSGATGTPVPSSEATPGVDQEVAVETPVATSPAAPEATDSGAASVPTPALDQASPAESPATTSPAAPDQSSSNPDNGSTPHAPIARLLIPAIGVDAPVEVMSIDSNGVMQTPNSAWTVAWYDFSARPEAVGNAVFAGHLDYAGVGPAVFWRLGDLNAGDQISVTKQDGGVVTYQVTSVQSYSTTGLASAVAEYD